VESFRRLSRREPQARKSRQQRSKPIGCMMESLTDEKKGCSASRISTRTSMDVKRSVAKLFDAERAAGSVGSRRDPSDDPKRFLPVVGLPHANALSMKDAAESTIVSGAVAEILADVPGRRVRRAVFFGGGGSPTFSSDPSEGLSAGRRSSGAGYIAFKGSRSRGKRELRSSSEGERSARRAAVLARGDPEARRGRSSSRAS